MENIACRVPINKQAAICTSQTTAKYCSEVPYWDINPGTLPCPKTITNYSGIEIGHIKIVGYFGLDKRTRGYSGRKRSTQDRHKWLYECSCGRLGIKPQRKIRKLLNLKDNSHVSCDACASVYCSTKLIIKDKNYLR
jgi:hypothetical protein